MFLGQIFAKNKRNDHETRFEASKSGENKIQNITVKSRNDVKRNRRNMSLLTSLTADLLRPGTGPGTSFFDTRCRIVARRGMASFVLLSALVSETLELLEL